MAVDLLARYASEQHLRREGVADLHGRCTYELLIESMSVQTLYDV